MNVLAPIAALATVAWAILLIRWGHLIAFALLVLFSGTILGPPFYHYDGPFQISSERLLWCVLMAMLAIHYLLGKTDPKPISRGDWLLLAFVGLLGVSSQFGEPLTDGSNPLARWLFYIALPTGLYFVARGATIGPKQLRWCINFLLAMGGYIAVMAVLESRGLHSVVFPRYIIDPTIWEFLGRGRGPLLNPSGIGIVMTGAIGAASLRWLDAKRVGKLGYAFLLVLLLAGCYSTLTRCVWLGAAGTIGFVGYLHMSRLARLWAIATGLVLAIGAGGFVAQALLEFKRDKEMSPSAAKESVELRPLLAVIAFEMFQDRPLLGHGYGHYLSSNQPYVENPEWKLPLANAGTYHQHNIVLSILVDCGLIGALLYVGILSWWTLEAWRLYRDSSLDQEIRIVGMTSLALMIGYLANGMFQDVTIIAMVHMYMLFFFGLCVGLRIRGGYSVVAAEQPIPAPGAASFVHWVKSPLTR